MPRVAFIHIQSSTQFLSSSTLHRFPARVPHLTGSIRISRRGLGEASVCRRLGLCSVQLSFRSSDTVRIAGYSEPSLWGNNFDSRKSCEKELRSATGIARCIAGVVTGHTVRTAVGISQTPPTPPRMHFQFLLPLHPCQSSLADAVCPRIDQSAELLAVQTKTHPK